MEKINKTKIEKRLKQKKNPVLVETLIKLKKTNPRAAKMLAKPNKRALKINLGEIDGKTKEGEKILITGKILSVGELKKKLKIVAWSASEKTIEKIKNSKAEYVSILEELKKNPSLEGLRMVD